MGNGRGDRLHMVYFLPRALRSIISFRPHGNSLSECGASSLSQRSWGLSRSRGTSVVRLLFSSPRSRNSIMGFPALGVFLLRHPLSC